MKSVRKTWFWFVVVFMVWRLFILVLALNANHFFPNVDLYRYFTQLVDWSLPETFFNQANFDGLHYLKIASSGYDNLGLIQAFFPLYPLLIRALSFLPFWHGGWHAHFFSALTLSTVATAGFLALFFKYLKTYFPNVSAWWALVAVLLFPCSFYLVSVYNESLFLLLLVGALILFKKQKWWALTLVLILLSATRIVGIIAVVAFALSFLISKLQNPKQKIAPLFFILLGSLGLMFYMIYLYFNFGDPLYFWTVQADFGASRQTNLVFLPQVLFRYGKIILTFMQNGTLFTWSSYAYLQEFFLSIITLCILIWQTLTLKLLQPWWQKFKIAFLAKRAISDLPIEILLFSGGAFLLPTLTGNLSSMPRYILSCLSIFIWFGGLKSKVWKIVILLISLALLVINMLLFSTGNWVA